MIRSRIPCFLLCLALAACASQSSPEDAQMANALCAQGKNLLVSGKAADARDIYASAVHRDEENPRAWNGLGVADDLLGKRGDALDAYRHAVDLDPNDLSAVNNLAHLYLETGDPEKAVQLLQPRANDAAAPKTLRQNLAAALKAAKTRAETASGAFADLGSYPTEGMAQGHIREARKILGGDAGDLNFAIEPEVKVGGGTPVFTIRVTGKPPQDICDDFNAQAFPCIAHE